MRYHFTTVIAIILLSVVGVAIAVGLLNFSAIGLLIPSVVWRFLGKIFRHVLLLSPVISFVALIFAIIGCVKTKSSESKGVFFAAIAVLLITIVGYLLLYGWLVLIASMFPKGVL